MKSHMSLDTLLFQSARPCEARPQAKSIPCDATPCFNPRALARRDDNARAENPVQSGFNPRALARRDSTVNAGVATGLVFQSARPCEARLD